MNLLYLALILYWLNNVLRLSLSYKIWKSINISLILHCNICHWGIIEPKIVISSLLLTVVVFFLHKVSSNKHLSNFTTFIYSPQYPKQTSISVYIFNCLNTWNINMRKKLICRFFAIKYNVNLNIYFSKVLYLFI